MRAKSRDFLLLFALTCANSAACEMPRPEGAYSQAAGDASVAAPDPMDDLGEGEIPDLGGDDPDPVERDAGMPMPDEDAGEPPDPETPLEALQRELSGDYYMRVDFYSTADANTVSIDTHTTAFALVKVGVDDTGVLKFIDWQCLVAIDQQCRSSCNSATTRISPAGARAYRPAIRTLDVDVDSGAFVTTDEWFATGWKGNAAEDVNAVLPAREGDPLVYDPDGGGAGVNVSLSVDASGLLPDVNCTLRVVQKYAQSYAGTLEGRTLAAGNVTDRGSDQVVLSYGNCPSGGSARQSAATTMRLVRATQPIDAQWTCPAESVFRSASPVP